MHDHLRCLHSVESIGSLAEDRLRGNETMDLKVSQRMRGRRQKAILNPSQTHLSGAL